MNAEDKFKLNHVVSRSTLSPTASDKDYKMRMKYLKENMKMPKKY